MPSIEGGGVEKNFFLITKHLSKNIKHVNLITAERGLSKKLPGINTIGAVAQISVFVDENQIIKHIGKLATFFVGGYDGKENKLLEDFCQSVQKIGLKIILKKNIKEKIWEKFIFLSAYSGMTTLFLKPIGEIFENKDLKKNLLMQCLKHIIYLRSMVFLLEVIR